MSQVTNTILMVRPISFRMNEQTAVNNYFQEDIDMMNEAINAKAQKEFDTFVEKIRAAGIQVITVQDTLKQDTPDSIFPNNWISTHEDGTVTLYPMFAENRRNERREDILDVLEANNFCVENVMDYTSAEEEGIFLEGTGSIILDRVHRKAYCALSPRADEDLFIEFCEDFEYFPVIFTANQDVDGVRKPIYHTNVMMCVGDNFAVVCLDTIDDKKERKNLVDHLKKDGKEIIVISETQMSNFAGNMLQAQSETGEKYLIMSKSAHESLHSNQTKSIEKYATILSSNLETIETCGGGSARCMMAEIFLPKK